MTGPLETEGQARSLPAVRAVYAAFDLDPGAGKMAPHNYRMLAEAAEAAGVELGAYDDRILHWLAGWEPATCAVLAGIISRARPPRIDGSIPAGPVSISADDLRTVLDALDVAADYKRAGAASCPECDTDPADLCGTCEWRLAVADGYDSLARRIGGQL